MHEYVTVTNSEQNMRSLIRPFGENYNWWWPGESFVENGDNVVLNTLALRTGDYERFTEVAVKTDPDVMVYADVVGNNETLATQIASVMLADPRRGFVLARDAFDCDMRGPPENWMCPGSRPERQILECWSLEYAILTPLKDTVVQRSGLGLWWSATIEVTPECSRWSPIASSWGEYIVYQGPRELDDYPTSRREASPQLYVYENRKLITIGDKEHLVYDTDGTPEIFRFTITVRLKADRMLTAYRAAGMEPPADLVRDALLLMTGMDVPISCGTLAFTSALALLHDLSASLPPLECSPGWWSTDPETRAYLYADTDRSEIIDPTDDYERVLSDKKERAIAIRSRQRANRPPAKCDRAHTTSPGAFTRRWGGKWQDRSMP